MPALNEELSVGVVVTELLGQTNECGEPIIDAIVVCDNGSADLTSETASMAGATVVFESRSGYGIAVQKALASIMQFHPDIIVFTDADDAFDANAITSLIEPIISGCDLVMGSRTLGQAEKGALSLSQRVGNRVATLMIGTLWNTTVTDLGPYRAIRADRLQELKMCDESFGWTVEMQVKAVQHGFIVREVPVQTKVRTGNSKISGTLKGVIGAGCGILSMIFALWLKEKITSNPVLNR